MESLVGEWERLASLARRGFLQGITLDIKGTAKTEHRHVLDSEGGQCDWNSMSKGEENRR